MNATTRQRCAVIVYIIYIVIITGLLHAQTLTGPTQSEPGALFVVDAAVPADGGAVYRLTFDPAAVQFMGLVAPTPEVQQTGDSTLELSPDKGKAGRYQIKFLPYPTASAAEFAFIPHVSGGSKLNVAFVAKSDEKQYHWHILAGGIFLLVVAWAVWRYQKKNPGLMSTRSLFLNFEELQKAREQFFAGQPEQPGPAAPDEPLPPQARPDEPVAAQPPPDSTQALPALPKKADAAALPDGAGRVGSTLEMPVSVQRPEAAAPAVDEPAQGIQQTPVSGIPAVPQERGTREVPTSKSPATAEMPVPLQAQKTGETADISKKTIARSGISAKLPAADPRDSTFPVMPQTPKQVIPVDSPDKTISRSGMSASVASKAAAASLHVKITDASGREFEGRGVEILIGRARECNIAMTAAEVSRRHLLIRRDAEKVFAIPQTSSNLTELNGARIQGKTEIHSGDKLSLGGTIFTIEIM